MNGGYTALRTVLLLEVLAMIVTVDTMRTTAPGSPDLVHRQIAEPTGSREGSDELCAPLGGEHRGFSVEIFRQPLGYCRPISTAVSD
eukprot:3073556-Rhodomonas_salina.1